MSLGADFLGNIYHTYVVFPEPSESKLQTSVPFVPQSSGYIS